MRCLVRIARWGVGLLVEVLWIIFLCFILFFLIAASILDRDSDRS